MSSKMAPVAVFAYNRCDHLKRMFASLQACHGFSESPVKIFIDGPKTEAGLAKVQAVRDFAHSLKLPNVEVVIRDKNMGLKKSIYVGVGELCKKYGRVIVFEDDFILSPVILDYFNQALDKYANTPRIWSVIGYQYDVPSLRNVDHALALTFPHPWGWATWDRAWSQYDIDAPVNPMDLSSRSFTHVFDADGVCDFKNMLCLALENKVSCWFVPWYYKMLHEGGLSVFPPRSYIANIGLGKGGTHASSLNPYRFLVKPQPPSDVLCKLPDEIKIDFWAIDAIRTSWDSLVQRIIIDLGRIKRLLFY